MEGTSVQLQPFLGISFRIIGFDPEAEAKVRSLLIKGSAVDAFTTGEDYSHLIVGDLEYDDPACVDARNSGKTIVNSIWVNHSLEIGVAVDSNSVIYRPVKNFNGIPGAKDIIVCLTGYQRQDREDIMVMTRLMGAQFFKPLVANKVTHLVCYKFEGEKYELAKKLKRIKLVNHRWLEDCLKDWKLQPEENYNTSGFELEIAASEAQDSDVEAEYKEKNIIQSQKDVCQHLAIGNDLQLSLRKEEEPGLTHTIKSEIPTLQCSGDVSKSPEPTKIFIEPKQSFVSSETRTDPNYLKSVNVGKSSWKSPKSTKREASNIAELSQKDGTNIVHGSISEITVDKEGNESSNFSVAGKNEDKKSSSLEKQQNNCTNAVLSSGQPAPKLPSPVNSLEKNEVIRTGDSSVQNANSRKKAGAKRPVGSKMKLNPITNRKGCIFLEKKDESNDVNSSASLPHSDAIANLELHMTKKDTHFGEAIGSINERYTDSSPKMAGKKKLAPNSNKRVRKREQLAVREPEVYGTNDKEKVTEKACDGGTANNANMELSLVDDKQSPSMAAGLKKRKGDGSEVRRTNAKEENTVLSTSKNESKVNAVSTTKSDVSEVKRVPANKTKTLTKADETVSNRSKEHALPTTKDDASEFEIPDAKKTRTSTEVDETVIYAANNDRKANALSTTEGDDLSEVKRASAIKKRTSNKISASVIPAPNNESKANASSTTHGDEVKSEGAKKTRTSIKTAETVTFATKNGSKENVLSITKGNVSEITRVNARKTRSSVKEEEPIFSATKNEGDRSKEEEAVKSIVKTGRKTRSSILAEESASEVKPSKNIHSTKEEPVLLTKTNRCTRSMTEKENLFPTEKEVLLSTDKNNGNLLKQDGTEKVLLANEGKRKREEKEMGVNGEVLAEKGKKCFLVSGERSQRKEYQRIIKRLGGKCCKDSHKWCYEATHFVAPAPLRRTEKFFAAAASGRWILKTDYLWACHEAGKLLDEEEYEWHGDGLTEDGAISLGAPRKWRMVRAHTAHGAFHSMRFVVYGECIAPSLDTLKRVVKSGDGLIVATCPPYTRVLKSGINYAVVSQGTPKADVWVQQFLDNGIPCVLPDYLVDFVCKPGFPLHKHVLFDSLP